jgi:hypothetical protein
VRIVAESPEEADLLSRPLPAIRHLLGLEPTTNLQGHRLEELLGTALAVADLERAFSQG